MVRFGSQWETNMAQLPSTPTFVSALVRSFRFAHKLTFFISIKTTSFSVLGSNPPSSFTPLQLAQQRQQHSRVSRGGFNTSDVANSEGFQDYFPNTFQISPSPPEQPLPPLNQCNYTENMAPTATKRPLLISWKCRSRPSRRREVTKIRGFRS